MRVGGNDGKDVYIWILTQKPIECWKEKICVQQWRRTVRFEPRASFVGLENNET